MATNDRIGSQTSGNGCEACNLCDSPSQFREASDVAYVPCHVKKFAHERFTVWRCRSCGSLHSQEPVSLEPYYEAYPFREQALDLGAKLAYRSLLRYLRRWGLKTTDRILDYGCGHGLLVQYLRMRGYKAAVGHDPYLEATNRPELLEQTYDFVVSFDVIEHVDNPRQTLSQLAALIRPGGMLVIGTPNAIHVSLHGRPFFDHELSQPYHRHIPSESALRQAASAAKLETVEVIGKWYYETLYPLVNSRFIWTYVETVGDGMLDVLWAPPQIWKIARAAPKLVWTGLFGGIMPSQKNMTAAFRKAA